MSAAVGDACALAEADGSHDAVLLLGPLYHLPERAERLRALAEARRVARPGAPVIAAGISRYASLMDLGSDGRLTADVEPFVEQLHATGRFRGGVIGFTTAYLHRPEELAADLADAGLHRVEVYGIEGPAAPPCARSGWTASSSVSTPRCGRRGSWNATRRSSPQAGTYSRSAGCRHRCAVVGSTGRLQVGAIRVWSGLDPTVPVRSLQSRRRLLRLAGWAPNGSTAVRSGPPATSSRGSNFGRRR